MRVQNASYVTATLNRHPGCRRNGRMDSGGPAAYDPGMSVHEISLVRDQIVDRREKLQAAVAAVGPRPELTALIAEVDAALRRVDTGAYGLCEVCQDPIEPDRLLADPLVRFCLDHLTPGEQRALERDLELAARIQRGLLPPPASAYTGWDIAYYYRPARLVSGDYCDLAAAGGATYFMLGDVSGKGVAASMLMSHLHAMMRALITPELPIDALVARANHMFCESTLPSHYATLVCGRAMPDGSVDLCNAGHVPPLVVRESGVERLAPGGIPVGLFCDQPFTCERLHLAPGELILLCSDGITDTACTGDEHYGLDRVADVVRARRGAGARAIVDACVADLDAWRCDPRHQDDDITIMVVRKAAGAGH